LVADYGQVRLFSSNPIAVIDGKPPTEEEVENLRGYRDGQEELNKRTIESLKTNRTKRASRTADLIEAARIAKECAGEDPEKKEVLRQLAETLVRADTPGSLGPDELVRVADMVAMLAGDSAERQGRLGELVDRIVRSRKSILKEDSSRTASRVVAKPLMEGQIDESNGSKSGVDFK
ncbi:MAG: hypothetical protein AAF394_11020, partial [Planctomycetota bacterium]